MLTDFCISILEKEFTMKKIRHAQLGLLAAVLVCTGSAVSLPASAQPPATEAVAAASTDSLRAEISKPLIAAQALFEAKNIPEALAKLAETDAVPNKTAYETFAVERTRANYLMAANDKPKAIIAFQAVVASNYLKRADQNNLIEALGQLYFQTSDYPNTILWLERYAKEGGTDPRATDVLNKAYFLNKDYAKAYQGLNTQAQADIAAGKVPAEQSLQLILNCVAQLKDDSATQKAVEQLNSYYPTAKSWNYLLSLVHTRPGFADRMYLDIYRLKQELALIKTAPEFLEMADLATRAGLPAEARKALEQGFAAGLLDKGADAKKNTTLLETARKRAAEDLKTMEQGEASASKSKDGTGLVNLGMAFATAGQFDKGASLIQQGITKGGMSRIEEAKLQLGVVYYWGGKKDQAIQQLKTVTGTDGTGELARFWLMQINHPLAEKAGS